MIPQITELQQREATDFATISTLKAIVQDKYNIVGTVKVFAESEKKQNKKMHRKRKGRN